MVFYLFFPLNFYQFSSFHHFSIFLTHLILFFNLSAGSYFLKCYFYHLQLNASVVSLLLGAVKGFKLILVNLTFLLYHKVIEIAPYGTDHGSTLFLFSYFSSVDTNITYIYLFFFTFQGSDINFKVICLELHFSSVTIW